MHVSRTDIEFAQDLDRQDELAPFREQFVITDPNLIYLDGNSLGRLPKKTAALMREIVDQGWGEGLIRSWSQDWVSLPTDLGAKIARLVGAQPGEIIVTESTSTNLFKLVTAALRARPNRTKVVSDVFNFPSDLYILQGVMDLLGQGHRLKLIPSGDSITILPDIAKAAIDRETALVALTHVAFKSAFMYDMAAITEAAHAAGSLVLWDLSHSVGAVPLDLNGCGVDLAVGCTYKYLNGGPGSPAFLYVSRKLQGQLTQPIWGWWGAKMPFAFELDYEPSGDIRHYQSGTAPVLSMAAIEPSLDMILEAGIDRLRAKSTQQSEYLIFLAEQWLLPQGFTLGSPRDALQRGSHVSLRHPEGWRINRALIEAEPPAIKVIPDFREPDNIRLGITPLYTTFTEIHQSMARLKVIVEEGLYQKYSSEKSLIT